MTAREATIGRVLRIETIGERPARHPRESTVDRGGQRGAYRTPSRPPRGLPEGAWEIRAGLPATHERLRKGQG